MVKKLYRDMTNKMLGGVCSGIAEYFEIDPTLIRLLWLAGIFCWGGGILAYIVAMIVIPKAPQDFFIER